MYLQNQVLGLILISKKHLFFVFIVVIMIVVNLVPTKDEYDIINCYKFLANLYKLYDK